MKRPVIYIGDPSRVKIAKLKGTLASYRWWYLYGVVCFTRIVLGNWSFKENHEYMANLADEELTVIALNEETIHSVLHRTVSEKATHEWDNFTMELRVFLQGAN